MFINGIEVLTTEVLEATIVDMSEANKTYFRNMFNGVPNTYTPTQTELDKIKYSKRASAIPEIMSQMAAENMERVRAGTWTVPQLVELTQDAQLKEILTDIYSLSFEIAYSKIDAISNPIVTQDVKNGWKAKLASNFN